jgi:prepilin-type N-terminal cleavage/methylation domain-containing protein
MAMSRFPARLAARLIRRAGFTLIEILAVILIIGILMTFLVPRVLDAIRGAEEVACKTNLQELYKGITLYKAKYQRLPSEPGVKLFGAIIAEGAWENTKSAAQRLTCPGVDVGALAGVAGLPETEWWKDLSVVDGSFSAYAGRDTKNFPLRQLSGKEPLIADDNDGGMNHSTTTNVLYGDGTVTSFELFTLRKDGTLSEEDEVLIVGPDSPVEDLRKFTLD